MPRTNDIFGRLLKGAIYSIGMHEGKNAPMVEDELGAEIGMAGKTIQGYKSGKVPPDRRTVEILAKAAIERGLMGREWLVKFLRAADYPAVDEFVEQLCPSGPVRQRPPRTYSNLPAPTYSQFVMRQQAFDAVLDGLKQRAAAVLIVGLGGNGKTSLAREVADYCLRDDEAGRRFDAVVWVSDKDRPGTTNLSTGLDAIAQTLDYPGVMQLAHDEKLYEVEQLLRRQRVLVVVDNFETTTDRALLDWLLRLPEPSKAIVTTREFRSELRSSWPVELRGMGDAEAEKLIDQRLRQLRIENLVVHRSQLNPLVAATGGNPKAIEMILGLVKYERRPLQQLVDDLYAGRGNLFDDLFNRAWSLLDEASRRVLLVMTLFANSVSSEALSATADVRSAGFNRAIERLTDLALLDAHQADIEAAPRFTLHPLVRSFATIELQARPILETEACDRWVAWYVSFANELGYRPDDVERLKRLDPEQETIHRVMEWVAQKHRYQDVLHLGKGVMYFLYVRGLWDVWFLANEMRLEAARQLGDEVEEILAIAYQIQMRSRQGRPEEVRSYIPMLDQLTAAKHLEEDPIFVVHRSMADYYVATGDLQAAQNTWEAYLRLPGLENHRRTVAAQQLLAQTLYRQGQHGQARQFFEEALREAVQHDYGRYIRFNRIWLAALYIDRGEIEHAAGLLAECYEQARSSNDREHMAHVQRLYAQFYTHRHEASSARAALTEAADLYERLGLRQELVEVQRELAIFEKGE